MAWEPEKLLTTRADVTKAALAATVAARDANLALEILKRSLADLSVLTDAVEILNHGLAALSLKLAGLQMDQEGNLAGEVADLKKQVDALKKAVKRLKKKKLNPTLRG
jgi:hypothetical protein